MRKILLATTALVGFAAAGAAQAATSPLSVTIGGDVEFVAGTFHESKAAITAANGGGATAADLHANDDFETLYSLNIGVAGKSGHGIEYGANLTLDNAPDIENGFYGNGNGLDVSEANIFLSGAFGKVVMGDSHGATDLMVGAPTVGAGQVMGRYMDFLDYDTFAKTMVVGVDGTDHSTNVTYLTPKVGNDAHKVQAGVTFAPQFYDYGSITTKNKLGSQSVNSATNNSPYRNVIKGAASYTGSFKPVTVGVSADIITGTSATSVANNYSWLSSAAAAKVRDFTAWSVGVQAAAEGFTLGGSYSDDGHYNTTIGQNRSQNRYNVGLKYEFSKVGVGISYLGGHGYDNMLDGVGTGATGAAQADRNSNYVKNFNAYGVGGTYTWAPGLTTNVDGVLFGQKTQTDVKNDGYVLLLSQKLAF